MCARAPQKRSEVILNLASQGDDFVFTQETGKLIKELWQHPAVQATFARSNELQLNDSAK